MTDVTGGHGDRPDDRWNSEPEATSHDTTGSPHDRDPRQGAPVDPDEALLATAVDQGDDEEEDERGLGFWAELPILVAIALILAVIVKTFLFQAFYILSGSMEDTL